MDAKANKSLRSGMVRLPAEFLAKLRIVAAARRVEMGQLLVQWSQGGLDRAYRSEIAKAQAEFDGGK